MKDLEVVGLRRTKALMAFTHPSGPSVLWPGTAPTWPSWCLGGNRIPGFEIIENELPNSTRVSKEVK